jgi:integrase
MDLRIRIYTSEECDRLVKVASDVQDESILEWDLVITLALTTGMRKGELLNLVWSDIDLAEMVVEVNPKPSGTQTWECRIKDTDRRQLPLKEDVCHLLIAGQKGTPMSSCLRGGMTTFSGYYGPRVSGACPVRGTRSFTTSRGSLRRYLL